MEQVMADENTPNLVDLATEITIAWLGNANNRVSPDDVPTFLRTIHATVAELSGAAATGAEQSHETGQSYEPAVSVRKSLASPDHIISMIDGKPYKTLRRHLSTHGLSPDEYRARYKLKADYPMVAPAYSEHRRAMAKKIGLGSKGRSSRGKAPATAAPAKRGRKPTAAE
jgi:predicted transcriptional regulator